MHPEMASRGGRSDSAKQVNKIRYVIEQVIANFKTWRVMHTDYRRPLETFATTISTVIALYFYAASWISLNAAQTNA